MTDCADDGDVTCKLVRDLICLKISLDFCLDRLLWNNNNLILNDLLIEIF